MLFFALQRRHARMLADESLVFERLFLEQVGVGFVQSRREFSVVQAQDVGIGFQKALDVDQVRQVIEPTLFKSQQMTTTDLGTGHHLLDGVSLAHALLAPTPGNAMPAFDRHATRRRHRENPMQGFLLKPSGPWVSKKTVWNKLCLEVIDDIETNTL